jgi:ComF family protein
VRFGAALAAMGRLGFDAAWSLVAPRPCVGCADALAAHDGFCAACAASLEPAPPRMVPGLDRVVVSYAYGGAVRAAVHRLKYAGAEWVAPVLAASLGQGEHGPDAVHPPGPRSALDGPRLVVPVPLSSARLAARGFNQALVLARAAPLGPADTVVPDGLTRRAGGAGDAQVGRSRSERFRAVEGAFGVREPARWAGAHVVLVDDVVTTGATLAALAAVLRAAGACVVEARVVASEAD